MTVNDAAAASRPTRLLVTAGTRQAVVPLDASGEGKLPGWTGRRLKLRVLSTERAFRVEGTNFVEAPAGVSELLINGRSPARTQGGNVVFPCGIRADAADRRAHAAYRGHGHAGRAGARRRGRRTQLRR